MDRVSSTLKQVLTLRWKPSWDLAAVAASWLLVVGALYTATNVFTPANGILYFLMYAVVGATLFGIGIPLYWIAVIRRRPVSDLGLTTGRWGLCIVLQLLFAGFQYVGTFAKTPLPPSDELLPLISLALSIGLFEAIFWRGWVLMRLEEAFGVIPGILLGSLLYAAYHIGYGMPLDEMVFLFFIGIMFSIAFRLTKSILVLWPVFQPMGQLVTLVKDRLTLPLIATLGFVEVLAVMLILIAVANRYYMKRIRPVALEHGR